MTTSDQHGPEYLHGAEASEQARLEAAVKIVGGAEFLPSLRPGMNIVEVGCGTGSLAREVASQVAPGEVVGVDRQEAQLDTARRLAQEHAVRNLRFCRGDANDLDFPYGTFDGAYCRFLLEHVASPVDAVREMARVVKPGGWVCANEWENGCSVVHPASPTVTHVWQALYDLQESLGGHPAIARRLYEVFTKAGLRSVEAVGQAWSITADEREKLLVYVDGAREIIRQGRDRLLGEGRVTAALLERADDEYRRLLESPFAFVMEGYVYATGTKGDAEGI